MFFHYKELWGIYMASQGVALTNAVQWSCVDYVNGAVSGVRGALITVSGKLNNLDIDQKIADLASNLFQLASEIRGRAVLAPLTKILKSFSTVVDLINIPGDIKWLWNGSLAINRTNVDMDLVAEFLKVIILSKKPVAEADPEEAQQGEDEEVDDLAHPSIRAAVEEKEAAIQVLRKVLETRSYHSEDIDAFHDDVALELINTLTEMYTLDAEDGEWQDQVRNAVHELNPYVSKTSSIARTFFSLANLTGAVMWTMEIASLTFEYVSQVAASLGSVQLFGMLSFAALTNVLGGFLIVANTAKCVDAGRRIFSEVTAKEQKAQAGRELASHSAEVAFWVCALTGALSPAGLLALGAVAAALAINRHWNAIRDPQIKVAA